MTIEELERKYLSLAHAMQSGVAYEMEIDPKCVEPKHLRVGINSAMVETSILAQLLISKGIISEQEFWEAMVDKMEQEVKNYEERLSNHYGGNIKLA